MRYYGQQLVDNITILRYEGIANQHVYSLPMSVSNSTFKTRADIVYYHNDSGFITVSECVTNNDLVGVTFQPGTAYVPEDILGNNTVRLESSNTIPIMTVINFNRRVNNDVVSKYPVDVNTIMVNGSYTIPSNTCAVIVEGTVIVGNTTADSNTNIFFISKLDGERVVSGEGKIVTFRVGIN